MSDLNAALGTALVERAMERVARDQATFGNATVLLQKRRAMLRTVLAIAGYKAGDDVSPALVAALDAGSSIVGLLNAAEPDDALADFIAVGISAAPMFEAVQIVRARLAEQARLQREQEERAAREQAAAAEPPANPAPETPEDDADFAEVEARGPAAEAPAHAA